MVFGSVTEREWEMGEWEGGDEKTKGAEIYMQRNMKAEEEEEGRGE